MGEFREIACSPSLQNSVATVCKSTDAAWRQVIKVPFHSQYRPVFANWCDLAVGRPISIQLSSLLWMPTSEEHLTPPLRNVLWSSDPLAIRLLCPQSHTLWIELQMLSTAGVVAIHCNDCWPRELRYCYSNMRSLLVAVVRLSVSDQWPVLHASVDVRSDRWYPHSHACALRPHKWRGPHVGGPHDPLHATHLGSLLSCMAAVATEQLHRWSQLARTATLRLDWLSPKRVPGNLFPSWEIKFPGN